MGSRGEFTQGSRSASGIKQRSGLLNCPHRVREARVGGYKLKARDLLTS
jgi:hypothetical protein